MNLDDISDYIDKSLNVGNSYNDSIDNFKRLESFIEKSNCSFEDDFWIQLLERNTTLSIIIKNIINKHKTKIVSGKVESLFDNDMIVSTIHPYCIVNDIEIEESCDLVYDNSGL